MDNDDEQKKGPSPGVSDRARGIYNTAQNVKSGAQALAGLKKGTGKKAAATAEQGAEKTAEKAAERTALRGLGGLAKKAAGGPAGTAVGLATEALGAAVATTQEEEERKSNNRLIFIIFGAIGLMVIIAFFFRGGGLPSLDTGGEGGSAVGPVGTGAPPIFPPIPGLTLTLTGPEFINNGELVSYSVTVLYDSSIATVPLDQITVFDDIPQFTDLDSATGNFNYNIETGTVSWSLSLDENKAGFSIILKPTKGDFFLENFVYARTDVAPPAAGTSGNACTAPYEGTGYCSVANLKKYFSDGTKALIASLICESESGSDPFNLNNNCATNDYSIGLFQINAVAHCPGAYGAGKFGPQSCDNLLSQSTRNVCEISWYNPEENIARALKTSSGGKYWAPWGTWLHAGKSPAVVETLNKCGINY